MTLNQYHIKSLYDLTISKSHYLKLLRNDYLWIYNSYLYEHRSNNIIMLIPSSINYHSI